LGQAALVVGHVLEGPGQTAIGIHVLVVLIEAGLEFQDFIAEHVGLDGDDAAETPTGNGQAVDQIALDAAVGLEVVMVAVEEALVFVRVLRFEHDLPGGETVLEGVLGRPGAAFEGGGSVGFGAVDARGFLLVGSRHGDVSFRAQDNGGKR
jgi:hypothetical protein